MKSKYVFLVGTDNSMKEFRQTMRRAMKVQEFLTVNKAPNVKKKKTKAQNQTKQSQNKTTNQTCILNPHWKIAMNYFCWI